MTDQLRPAPDLGALDARASLELLRVLKCSDYRFVTPTPATHQRVLRRADKAAAASARDVLGWSLPFHADALDPPILAALQAAGAIECVEGRFRATVRISSLGADLLIHSAFPARAKDAVFFGPDTYRFARFMRDHLSGRTDVGRLVDVGTGSGAGAIAAARACAPREIIATDVNPVALAVAAINVRAAGLEVDLRLGDGLSSVQGLIDVIVANPPFIAGDGGRTYRDGGDMHGARLSLDWALAGARRLAPGGQLLLYTGTAIVDGHDALLAALDAGLDSGIFAVDYQELDPDIFGELLGSDAYRDVDRIAAVGAVITRRL